MGSNASSISPQSIASLLMAPQSNVANNGNEPSLTNDETAEDFDVDEIFPDFNAEPKQKKKKTQKEKEKEEETKKEDIFGDDEPDLEAQNNHKKAWKKLEFVENATVATEQELQQNAIVPAPISKS